MKNSGFTFIKMIIGILAVFAFIVIGYQLYKYNFATIKTENAVMGEMEEAVKSVGVFFRDEETISNSGYEYLDVIREEGERIASGGTIARVYSNEHSAKIQKEIRQIENKIETYEEVLSHSGSYQSASDSIEMEIYNDMGSVALSAHEGNAVGAFDNAERLIINIMKKKIASGDLVQYDSVLSALRQERSSLKASGSNSVKTLSTARSGYFSLQTDGLEEVFDKDTLESLSVENYDEILLKCESTQEDKDAIGKMVYDNSWSVALKVQTDDIALLENGNTVYIRIPSYGSDRIKCTVSDVRKSGKESIVVLNSSVIVDNILTLRSEEIHLIIKTHSGLLVRQSALRKVDGEDGVYVKVGLLLKYKPVDILYNDGNSAVIDYNVANESGLRIYDQVVYKGSKLYDRKAVS